MVHPLAGFRPEGIEELVAKVSTLSQCLFKFPHTINYKLYLMTAKLHFYTWLLRPSNKTNKRIVTKLADYGKSQQLKRCLSFPLALTDCFGEKPEKLSEQYIVSNRRYLRILESSIANDMSSTQLRVPSVTVRFDMSEQGKSETLRFSHAQNDYANFLRQLHF